MSSNEEPEAADPRRHGLLQPERHRRYAYGAQRFWIDPDPQHHPWRHLEFIRQLFGYNYTGYSWASHW